MFERSKYNWATSQIEASCKFDYAATPDAIEFVESFLAQEEIFQMTNEKRKQSGLDWYKSVAAVIMYLHKNSEEELPIFQRRLYALIFAACAFKAGGIAPGSSPTDVLGDSYEEFGVDRSELL